MICECRRLNYAEKVYDIVHADILFMGGLCFLRLIALRAVWHVQQPTAVFYCSIQGELREGRVLRA